MDDLPSIMLGLFIFVAYAIWILSALRVALYMLKRTDKNNKEEETSMKIDTSNLNKLTSVEIGDIIEITTGEGIQYYIVMVEIIGEQKRLRSFDGRTHYGRPFNDISELNITRPYKHYPQSEYKLMLVKK